MFVRQFRDEVIKFNAIVIALSPACDTQVHVHLRFMVHTAPELTDRGLM